MVATYRGHLIGYSRLLQTVRPADLQWVQSRTKQQQISSYLVGQRPMEKLALQNKARKGKKHHVDPGKEKDFGEN